MRVLQISRVMRDEPVQELFIFPLNTVLFPGAVLPLKIFEQRYMEMTKICLRDNRPFGVCLIREGSEVGPPAVPEPVGCVATITQWDMPQLGVFSLLVQGGERFTIVEGSAAPNGLITATVKIWEPEATGAPVDHACREVLKLLIERAGARALPQPIRMDDAAWVSYRLAEILSLTPAAQQQLLEIPDAGERLQRLRAALIAQGLVR
jgi:uncharacterized protein